MGLFILRGGQPETKRYSSRLGESGSAQGGRLGFGAGEKGGDGGILPRTRIL